MIQPNHSRFHSTLSVTLSSGKAYYIPNRLSPQKQTQDANDEGYDLWLPVQHKFEFYKWHC